MLKSEENKNHERPGSSYKVYRLLPNNPLQNIWHRFTKLSKIGLSIEISVVDLFQFSRVLTDLHFCKGYWVLGYKCLQLISRFS